MIDEASRPTQVVVNHEEQYSIWPADREPPAGWRPAGFQGTRDECLEHVRAVWTDMTPKSLRQGGANGEGPVPREPSWELRGSRVAMGGRGDEGKHGDLDPDRDGTVRKG